MNRILSLDGGGIRGVFSLAILERIEAILRERYGSEKPGFVLSDYFNFIGGTSTGAIIAAMLSKGMSVRAIRESYEQLGPIVFRRKPIWQSWRSFYGSEGFIEMLKDLFEESPGVPMTLGSSKLITTLMLVMRNGSTGSPWPLTNHPEALYNRRGEEGIATNLDLPLWQIIRASAAAPAYFPTELVKLHTLSGEEKVFEFVDGGITPYNNPSMAMVMAATLPQFGMKMPTGKDKLFVCSVGTGMAPMRFEPGKLGEINVIGGALRSLRGLMESVGKEQDKLCRVLGDCQFGEPVDSEIGDLKGQGMGLFRYCRYQHEFTDEEIERCRRQTGSRSPFALDDLVGLPSLLETGREYAKASVVASHLPD